MDRKSDRSSSFAEFIEENQKAIVTLLLLVTIIGGIVAFRYYKHTREDPEFCVSCHLMKEAFKSWEMSKHRDFQCQICHTMNILEQNKMLVAFVVKGKESTKQQHGRISPWSACRGCHMTDVEQGSVTLSKSYGHAKHVFMHKIDCIKCHTGSSHNFRPDEQACSGCHANKLIHGMGMEGLSCLNCHSYSEKAPMMVTKERCLRCHKNMPDKGIMSTLNCFDCHHPHGKIKPSNQDCLKNCHGNEAKVGQHNLHMTKAGLNCQDCHKAHIWSIGKKEAANLCNRCHKLKDPATFIY